MKGIINQSTPSTWLTLVSKIVSNIQETMILMVNTGSVACHFLALALF